MVWATEKVRRGRDVNTMERFREYPSVDDHIELCVAHLPLSLRLAALRKAWFHKVLTLTLATDLAVGSKGEWEGMMHLSYLPGLVTIPYIWHRISSSAAYLIYICIYSRVKTVSQAQGPDLAFAGWKVAGGK